MLNIKDIDMITGFLDFNENQLLSNKTLFSDSVFLQQKIDFPEHNVSLYNLDTGSVGFQVIVDRDRNNKIITQRTYYFDVNPENIFERISINCRSVPLGKVLFVPRLNKDVLISLEEGMQPHETYIKADVW